MSLRHYESSAENCRWAATPAMKVDVDSHANSYATGCSLNTARSAAILRWIVNLLMQRFRCRPEATEKSPEQPEAEAVRSCHGSLPKRVLDLGECRIERLNDRLVCRVVGVPCVLERNAWRTARPRWTASDRIGSLPRYQS